MQCETKKSNFSGGADGDETESDAMPEVAEAAGAPGRQSSMVFAKSMRPGDLLP